MFQHLQFFILLASQPLSLTEHLRFRPVCCVSASLGTPGALSWSVPGVPWYPFRQLNQIWIFSLRLRSVFSGRSRVRLLGVLRRALLSYSGRSLVCLLKLFPYWGDHLLRDISMAS